MIVLKRLRNNKVMAAIGVATVYILMVNLNFYKKSIIMDEHRALAKDLGGGDCSIDPIADIKEAEPGTTKTLLTSYPGSGKRFTWQVIQGLTNHEVADDWDFSGNLKHSPLTVKTSWPHKQGIWAWEDEMDQVILLIRNPRWALPSYSTVRYELDYADNWLSSFYNMGYVYSKRPNISVWKAWRDENFDLEMGNWISFIDFWIQGGIPDGKTSPHPRCIVNKIDCKPKLLIDFDNFYQENPSVPFFKLSTVLDQLDNVEQIAAQARVCVLEKIIHKPELHNAKRNGAGPAPPAYRFTAAQLGIMEEKVTNLKDKYDAEPWESDPLAQALVVALNAYLAAISGEKYFEEMMESFGL